MIKTCMLKVLVGTKDVCAGGSGAACKRYRGGCVLNRKYLLTLNMARLRGLKIKLNIMPG